MLLSNFNLLATAPGGVARLRELILTLAVQGKLVPQDAADEPAAVLLGKIRAEKDQLIAAGEIRRDKPLTEISEEEKPFELPESWAWVRLPQIYYSISPSGSKLLSSAVQPEGMYPVVDQGQRPIAGYTNDQSLVIEIPGPVIVFGDHTKEIKYVDFDFVAGADGTKILRSIFQDARFFACQLRSFKLEHRGYARHFKVLNSHLFAVPPLAEQSRIVTRVEELMRLCDALEAKGKLEAAQHAQLVSSLLATLTESRTPEALAANWQRISQHFDLLLDRPEAVDALEQTILQLAVRGLLVPQNPQDEPASVLLQKIRVEKDRLIAEGKIRRDKPLAGISEEGMPFELPNQWAWGRFGDLVLVSSGITLGRKTAIPSPISLPYLRVANVQRWHLNLNSMKDVVIDQSELPRFKLQNGDLLITEGGDWDKVGRTTIWHDELPVCLHQNHVFKARGTSPDWNPIWAELFLNSAFARTYFASSAKQTTNLASINMTQLKDCVFPLPPLAEQSRIVTQVNTLRRLCADLRQRLASSQTTQAQLAAALLEAPAA